MPKAPKGAKARAAREPRDVRVDLFALDYGLPVLAQDEGHDAALDAWNEAKDAGTLRLIKDDDRLISPTGKRWIVERCAVVVDENGEPTHLAFGPDALKFVKRREESGRATRPGPFLNPWAVTALDWADEAYKRSDKVSAPRKTRKASKAVPAVRSERSRKASRKAARNPAPTLDDLAAQVAALSEALRKFSK